MMAEHDQVRESKLYYENGNYHHFDDNSKRYTKFFQNSGNLVWNIPSPHENFPPILQSYKSET